MERVAILGAGPAGAFLARLLSDKGYTVKVYDVSPRLAAKPCGWGVPYTVEKVYKIPGEAVLAEVNSFTVTVDWTYTLSAEGRFGYIVDKPALLKSLLEGVDATLGRTAKPRELEGWLTIHARGHAYYPGRKALAVQVLARGPWREDVAAAYYFSGLLGYAWVFPLGGGLAKVGVGGLASWATLKSLLHGLLARLKGEPASRLEGAPIAVGGLTPRGLAVGEEIGAVMPLTGEGIRPGFLSAMALADALEGRPLRDALEATGLPLQLRIQAGLLKLLERLTPPARAALWRRVDADALARVAAGDVSRRWLLSWAARHPRIAGIVAKALGGTRG